MGLNPNTKIANRLTDLKGHSLPITVRPQLPYLRDRNSSGPPLKPSPQSTLRGSLIQSGRQVIDYSPPLPERDAPRHPEVQNGRPISLEFSVVPELLQKIVAPRYQLLEFFQVPLKRA